MSRPSLFELENHDEFVGRHIGPTRRQQAEMARATGYDDLDALIEDTVPRAIRRAQPLQLPGARSEVEVIAYLRSLAERNVVNRSFIGCGFHDTVTPPVIQRNVLENPGWYTAYTPYQPEISQGRLEALLTFQQMILDLTGMELANASMLDESTAAAEAMTLLQRVNKKSRSKTFLIAEDCHPQTIAVVTTRAEALGITVRVGEPYALLEETDAFGLLLQYPGTYGHLADPSALIERAHAADTLVAVAADIMALLMVVPPGSLGADVVVGNTQRFGIPMGFGGPHAAFFATRDAYKRSTPGRIIGVSIDRRGNQALRMAMQTREQHIRREKATSNICTAQALLAIMAAFYAMYHGPGGLRRIATRIQRLTGILAKGLADAGWQADNTTFFDTLTYSVGDERDAIVARALAAGMNLRIVGHDRVGIALDETTTRSDIETLWEVFTGNATGPGAVSLDAEVLENGGIPDALLRPLDYLQHPLFNDYHSETEMLRYLRRLEDRDIALNRAMIPLGSCTMKLNATTEMLPITWPEFARMHPFAPAEQTSGYRAMLDELEHMLRECTGYDAISLQPNAGSQGEYAGLSRRHTARRVFDPLLRARHQPRERCSRRHARGDCGVRSPGQCGPGRSARESPAARRNALVHHGHLPLHTRRVRGINHRAVRGRAPARRTGVCGWRQPECAGRHRRAGGIRRRCLAPEPAQNLLHTPRWRRARHGAHRRGRASAALPAEQPGGTGTRPRQRQRYRVGHALRQRIHPAHILGVHRADGRRRTHRGNQGRHPERELHRQPPAGSLPHSVHRQHR